MKPETKPVTQRCRSDTIDEYLGRLEQTRFLAPPEADLEMDDRMKPMKSPGRKTPCGVQRISCVSAVSGNTFNPNRQRSHR